MFASGRVAAAMFSTSVRVVIVVTAIVDGLAVRGPADNIIVRPIDGISKHRMAGPTIAIVSGLPRTSSSSQPRDGSLFRSRICFWQYRRVGNGTSTWGEQRRSHQAGYELRVGGLHRLPAIRSLDREQS